MREKCRTVFFLPLLAVITGIFLVSGCSSSVQSAVTAEGETAKSSEESRLEEALSKESQTQEGPLEENPLEDNSLKENQSEENPSGGTTSEEAQGENRILSEREPGGEGSQAVSVRIFHSDGEEKNICVNTAFTEKVTPEVLLLNLAYYGMFPDTMTAESFRQEEKGNELYLTLNLPGDFRDFLSAQEGDKEALVVGSLVNTFLDAYQAEAIKITAGEEALETDSNAYKGWLNMYPYVEASYTVEDILLSDETVFFHYPQLAGLGSTEIQDTWNTRIEERTLAMAAELPEGSSIKGDYKIKTMNDELLSILMFGEISEQGGKSSRRFEYTYNIDMATGEYVRLAHYRNVEQIARDMMEGKGYTADGESEGEFQERLMIMYGDQQQLAAALRGFDFGDGQENPPGYSYRQDGKTYLCIRVPHALGDFIDIELE